MKRTVFAPWMTAVAGYGALVVIVFKRAILPPPGWLLFGDDIHRSYYFYRQFFNSWIAKGIFPWWNPYLFGGAPYVADPIVNLWYPVNWLFMVLPLNVAYSWHVAFHIVWAMTGMYALSRKFRAPHLAAWTSGALFGLSGFFMARTWSGHVDVLAAASYLPWVVLAMQAAQTGAFRSILVASLAFALQLLSGYQTMAMMTVIVVAIAAVVRAAGERSVKPVVASIAAGLGGIGLAAFHLIPVQEFFLRSIRTYSLPYSWVSYGAWEWRSLVQMVNPFYFGDQRLYNGPPPNFGEHSAFIGVAGLVLACIGMLAAFRHGKRDARPFIAAVLIAVVFGIWMSLGPNAPIDLQHMAWRMIPTYKYLRIPTRHLILVVFGLSYLAGVGMAQVSALAGKRFAKLPLILALVAGIEMAAFGSHFIEMHEVPEARHDRTLVAAISRDTEPFRVLTDYGVWLDTRDALDFDSPMQYGAFSATGYGPGILRSYYEYVARAAGQSGEQAMLSHDVQVPYLSPGQARYIDRLNIKYLVVPPDYDPFAGNTRYRNILESSEKQYRVYENTTVLPRFFFEDSRCGSATVTYYTPNRIDLAVESACDANLLSSEVWYPGWEAKVDGKNTRIDRTDNVFRTIFVHPGKHTVTYEYRPKIFIAGGLVTLFTVLVFAAAGLRVNGVRRAST